MPTSGSKSAPAKGEASARQPLPAPPATLQVAYQAPIIAPGPTPDPLRETEKGELSLDELLVEVEARNPSLQAALAAWNAAAQRYPQAVSLDDPMFTYMIAPTSGLGGDNGGWMTQFSQRVPWPGKRSLRGSAAAAEADAMRGEMGDTRLKLAEMTRMAFYDYYLSARLSEVNESNRKLLNQFRQLARTQYEANKATQQDVLQVDVELAGTQSRATELTRDSRVAAARINTLLHQVPDTPLPPPPVQLALSDGLPAVESLQQAAVRARPDLYAAHARVQAEEANLALACKEYYPDIEVMAKYDAFMPEDMRPAVGMQMNVPLHNARRSAAVSQAEASVQQRRWEYQNLLDDVRYEVQSADVRAEQARQVVILYRESILPVSRRNVDSAQANYTSGKLDFLRLIDAQRQLNAQQEMYYRAIAEYHRRLAELDRAVGARIETAAR
jgi:outer membrane protein, heavy metal efflux system